MITKAKFTNYKLLRDVEIPFGRLNVIIGANGVGKSSVLEGLSIVSELVAGKHRGGDLRGLLESVFSGEHALATLMSRPDGRSMGLEVSAREHRFALLGEQGEAGAAASFAVDYAGPLGAEQFSTKSNQTQVGYQVVRKASEGGFGNMAQLRFDALVLQEPHYSAERDVRMAFDGEGLASVLQRIQIARDDRLERIEREVALVVPAVRRIRTTQEIITRIEEIPVTIDGQSSWASHRREHMGAGFEVEWGSVGWVSARHLSEGTLLVIGLVTLLLYSPPSIVLIDDLDKALHPTAQRDVVRLLKRCLDTNPSLQILATSHSPFVVDELEPENVLVAGSFDERTTQIRPLTDHPDWRRKSGYLDPGEFWSAVGEAWVGEKKQ